MNAAQFLLDALEARKTAHRVLHSRLPGRVIYFKASMRRAISKWQQYAEIRRVIQ